MTLFGMNPPMSEVLFQIAQLVPGSTPILDTRRTIQIPDLPPPGRKWSYPAPRASAIQLLTPTGIASSSTWNRG